jgi:hypothetical protein
MRRPRPYISIATRILVAERQLFLQEGHLHRSPLLEKYRCLHIGKKDRLQWLLKVLFQDDVPQLDHDPALILRPFNEETGKYDPDANDPEFLVWREKADHQEKTTGRRPGARCTITTKGSDIGLKTKFAKLERKPRLTPKIPSRGFQKQKRKIGR